MQTIYVTNKSERKSAESLEPSELLTNIRSCEDVLRNGSELYDPQWVAYYALTCANVLKLKGFESGIVQHELLSHKPDNCNAPRWLKRYYDKHRAFLVLLGWMRYFKARGVDLDIRRTENLLQLFKTHDSWNEPRQYMDFTELPAAHRLTP